MGRREFESQIASAPRQSFQYFSHLPTTSVAAGAQENIDIYAPAGKIGRIINCNLLFTKVSASAVAATTGNHSLEIKPTSYTGGYLIIFSSYNVDIQLGYNTVLSGDLQVQPPDKAAFQSQISNIYFDAITAIRFQYNNNTDQPQTLERKYQSNYILIDIAT